MDEVVKEPDANSNSLEFILKRSLMSKNKLAMILEGPNGQTQYGCVECPARYLDKEKLEIHLCTHYKEYRFLCGICGTGLKRKEHLDRHTLGHQELRPHICPECGKGFKRKEHLNIHFSIHSGDKSQVCPLCDRSFYRKDHLQKHLQTHNKLFVEQNIFPLSDHELMEIKQEVIDDEDVKPDISGDLDGIGCQTEIDEESQGSVTQSNGQAMTHRPNFDQSRPHKCVVCPKTFKRKDHLKLHSMTHLKRDKVCSECGKGFHTEEQLLGHMSVHLKSFSQEGGDDDPAHSLLVEHTSIEILPLDSSGLLMPRAECKSEERPHECPVCHRKFKRKQHLKVHSNVHAKQPSPTIWCSLCNEGFQSNLQFENHHCMTTNHYNVEDTYSYQEEQNNVPTDAKKENNYPSEFVEVIEDENMTYTDLQSVTLTPAEERHLPTPQRVYVCKYCSKPFKRKDHYKIHLHIHTGIKSFFCPECGKGFYRKDHLQKHGLVHQREKPRSKKEMPDLFPINLLPRKKEVKPEITITAPSNTKLRVPLQIKVPYQVVMCMDNGEQRAVTIDPQAGAKAIDIDS